MALILEASRYRILHYRQDIPARSFSPLMVAAISGSLNQSPMQSVNIAPAMGPGISGRYQHLKPARSTWFLTTMGTSGSQKNGPIRLASSTPYHSSSTKLLLQAPLAGPMALPAPILPRARYGLRKTVAA